MKYLLIIVTLLLFSCQSTFVLYESSYEFSKSKAITENNTEEIILTGNFEEQRIFLSNFDRNGDVNWKRFYRTEILSHVDQIVSKNNNSTIVLGSRLAPNSIFSIAHFNGNGDLSSMTNYQSNIIPNPLLINEAILLPSNKIVAVGTFSNSGFIVMIDNMNSIEWIKTIQLDDFDTVVKDIVYQNNQLYIVGEVVNEQISFVSKFDLTGSLIISKAFFEYSGLSISSINNIIYVGGHSWPQPRKPYLLRMTSNLDFVALQNYATNDNVVYEDCSINPGHQNGVVITGNCDYNTLNTPFLIQTNINGHTNEAIYFDDSPANQIIGSDWVENPLTHQNGYSFLIRYLVNNNIRSGFVRTDPSGKTDCAKSENIKYNREEIELENITISAINFSFDSHNNNLIPEVRGNYIGTKKCEDSFWIGF